MAAAVETSLISSYTSLSDPQVQDLIKQPTTDLVTAFLQSLVPKIKEYNKTKSERLRLDVEHENAVRGAESQARQLKAKLELTSREAQDLKSKVEDGDTARLELQQQIDSLKSTTTTSSANSEALQESIDRLEKSNRDTLSLLNAKSTAHDKLAQDIATQHQKAVESRCEISELEQRLQACESTISSAKFKESQLESEVERLKRNNDWFDAELKTKAVEHTKFRKEKNAKIAELQRALEDARQTIESSQRSETSLRRRFEEISEKANDSFAKIQQMREDAANREEDFRIEGDNRRRLADLQEQKIETARGRLLQVEEQLDQAKSDAATELGELQSELEGERIGRETSERRVEQLELELRNTQAEVQTASRHEVPSTPRSRPNGLSTPGRGRSPAAFSPGPGHSRTGNYTQLLSEYNEIRAEFEQERRAHVILRQTFDEMVSELQGKEPELQQAQEDRDHFESEFTQLSSLLETARQERETARRDARKQHSIAESSQRQARNLEQQLRDLSAQVKVLLVELQIREQGGALDPVQRDLLQRSARGDLEGAAVEGLSDTGQFISNNLVAFRDVFELQQKNMELTKIVREVGEEREQEEAKNKAAKGNSDELEHLRGRVERYQEELKTLRTQLQSYIQERDMFRRMVSHRGKLPADADLESMFGASVNGAGTPRTPQNRKGATPDPEHSSLANDLSNHVKLLRELQAHFDAYKHEAAQDYTAAKSQAESANKERNQLQSEVIRANGQVTLLQERYQMLQSNFEQARSENGELQKRLNALRENAAKQDLRTQSAAEDLIEARSATEGLRNENAHLKAEKDLQKRIETRLNEDNRALLVEKTSVTKSNTNLQNLLNERELNESEIRRKLNSQVENLTSELSTVRRKLEEETESTKNAGLRREYEHDQSQTRIDDLMRSASQTKEDLAVAKSTRDQLQSRVDELKIELRSAEERAQALQPRPTPRSATSQGNNDVNGDGLSREQELGIELVEVKRELELAKADLEAAKSQVDEYRTLAEDSEERLVSLSNTYDQYKEDTDKVTAEKDEATKNLEQRIIDLSSELSTVNEELSQMRASSADHDTRLRQQREAFETELSHAKDECDRFKETANYHQQDLKAQAEVANQAQQSYESELIKHGQAREALTKLRDDLNQSKLELSQSKADAEAARMALSKNEDNWSSTKDQYEKELADIKARRAEVVAQNTLLHNQLQNVGGQISALQQNRVMPALDEEAEMIGSPSSSLGNLQDVIKYLRREKEIVDVQHELSVQEARRFKQQLDYTTSQLDEARSRLSEEQHKQTNHETEAINHGKLMNTLTELNLIRESNSTLRNDTEQAKSQAADRGKQIEELQAQLQPLQVSVRELEGHLEAAQKEKSLAVEHSNSLQQRISNILQKYDRIDPAELEALRDQIAKLESERDEMVQQFGPLQEKINGFADELKQAQEEARKATVERLASQFKERSKVLSDKAKQSQDENKTLRTQLEAVQSELETAQKARDEAVTKLEAALSQSGDPNATPTTQNEAQNGADEGQVDENGNDGVSQNLRNQVATANNLAQSRLQELEASKAEFDTARNKLADLEKQLSEQQSRLESHQNELKTLREQSSETEQSGHLEKLTADLSAAQGELQALRSQTSGLQVQAFADPASGSNQSTVTGQDLEARSVVLENALQMKMEELEAKYNERVQNMRQQLSTKLTEGKAVHRAEVAKEHEAAIRELQNQLDEARKQLTDAATKEDSATAPATAQLNDAAIPATSENAAADGEAETDVKTETATPPDQWTRPQITNFIQTNTDAKAIMAANIRRRVDMEIAKLKENQEQDPSSTLESKIAEIQANAARETNEKLEEAQQKAVKAKEQAVSLEGKKFSVKLNLAENRAKAAGAKVEIVERAAKETPLKPVGEVWEIAKVAKGAPAPIQTNAAPATPAGQVPSPRPNGIQQQRKPSQANNVTAAATQATPTALRADQQQAPAIREPETHSPKPEQAGTQQQQSSPPRGPQQQQPVGTGPAALRGITNTNTNVGTGIPRGGASVRGAANRGGPARGQSGLPRGGMPVRGGAGRGRGQGQQGQGQGQQGGATNPGAQQLTPGNKRPREDSAGDVGNKRPRGGQSQA